MMSCITRNLNIVAILKKKKKKKQIENKFCVNKTIYST